MVVLIKQGCQRCLFGLIQAAVELQQVLTARQLAEDLLEGAPEVTIEQEELEREVA